MVNVGSGLADPLDSIAELLTCFAHCIAEALGGESVGIDINVQSIVAPRTVRLRDDAQVERIDAVLAQPMTYFVQLSLIQRPDPREDRRALPMGKRQLLAGEYAGIIVVVRHEHHVGRASGHT